VNGKKENLAKWKLSYKKITMTFERILKFLHQ